MEVITLNLIPGGATQVVHASQFDKGRQFKLVTYNGDEPFNPSTYTASFRCIKPDGNIVEANVSADTTSVTVTTTEQMCAVEGDTICEIRFTKNSDVIGTANFILRIEMDPIFKGTSSESEGEIYDTLQWLKNNKENRLVAGTNIQISRTGGNTPRTTISATDTIYTAGAGIAISANKEISANISTFPFPIASTASLGCIKVGANLVIDPDGTLSSTGGGGGGGYEYLAGDNIQISEARRISATDTTYTAGNGIDITGASNEISVNMSDLADASTSSAGLMTANDKIKLDGIEANANNYTLPEATTSSLGGIIVGDNLSVNSGIISVPTTSSVASGSSTIVTSGGVWTYINQTILNASY